MVIFLVNDICYNLPQTLHIIARNKLLSVPKEMECCHLVYIPEIGYVIAVTNWKSPIALEYNDFYHHKFTLNGVHYCKNVLTNGKVLYYIITDILLWKKD